MASFYSVVLRMAALNQQCISRWDYFVPTGAGTGNAQELLTLMGFQPTGSPPVFATGTIMSQYQAFCSPDLQFLEAQAEELYTPTDFYTAAFSPAPVGGASGEIISITDAFGLFSSRVRTDIRRGFKRFPGVPSEAYDGGSRITSSFQVGLENIASLMSSVLGGDTASYSPAVFQFQEYTTPRGNVAYKKYATAAEQADHVAYPLSWNIYDTIRTQVSRQLGRGS